MRTAQQTNYLRHEEWALLSFLGTGIMELLGFLFGISLIHDQRAPGLGFAILLTITALFLEALLVAYYICTNEDNRRLKRAWNFADVTTLGGIFTSFIVTAFGAYAIFNGLLLGVIAWVAIINIMLALVVVFFRWLAARWNDR